MHLVSRDPPQLGLREQTCTSTFPAIQRAIRPLTHLRRQEQNSQSGSRGDANFVWKCKNCKVRHPLSSWTVND